MNGLVVNSEVGLCGSYWVLVSKKLDQVVLLVLKVADPWFNACPSVNYQNLINAVGA